MANTNNKVLLKLNDVLKTYKNRDAGIKALLKYKYWFPIKASPELAGIVADLMGDGHLQGTPKWRLDYSSKSVQELDRSNRIIFTLFGIKGKIRDCKTNMYKTMNLGINNKPLARVLMLLGVPVGPKVFTKFGIPNWVLEDKVCFARFVNRLFSCEGSVDVKGRCIEINMHKSVTMLDDGLTFFNQIKDGLDRYYGIKSTNPFVRNPICLRKDGKQTQGVVLKIKRRESVVCFEKFIGLDEPDKDRKLKTLVMKKS